MSGVVSLQRREWVLLLMTALIGMTCSFGVDMHCPSLPALVTYFNTSVRLGQASVTLYMMSMMVCQLIYGPISDRVGRKRVILFGLVVAVIGTMVCLLSTSIYIFLLGRVIQGAGAAVGMGLGRSILNDVFSKEKMVVYGSYVSIVLSVGLLLAPMMGGYCQSWWGWRGSFEAMGFFFLLAVLLVSLFLRETADTEHHQGQSFYRIIKGYGYLLTQPVFMLYSVSAGIGLGLTLTYSTMSSFIIQGHYLQTAIVYGWMSALIGGASFLGKCLSSRCVKLLGVRRGVTVGMVCFLVAGVILFISQRAGSLPMLFFVALVFGATLGQGFIFSNSVAGALSDYKSMSGTAGALYGAMQNGMGFLVSLLVSSAGFHSVESFSMSYIILAGGGLWILLGLKGRVACLSASEFV